MMKFAVNDFMTCSDNSIGNGSRERPSSWFALAAAIFTIASRYNHLGKKVKGNSTYGKVFYSTHGLNTIINLLWNITFAKQIFFRTGPA
jgi:hypothetical protein